MRTDPVDKIGNRAISIGMASLKFSTGTIRGWSATSSGKVC
jgi:hypothetical protein